MYALNIANMFETPEFDANTTDVNITWNITRFTAD